MVANPTQQPRSAATLAATADRAALGFAGLSPFEGIDAEDQMAWSEAADSHLLRLVMCAAFATLTLALVSSLA